VPKNRICEQHDPYGPSAKTGPGGLGHNLLWKRDLQRSKWNLLRTESAIHVEHWVVWQRVHWIGDERVSLKNKIADSLEGGGTHTQPTQSRSRIA
jgi:hypothetical protein